MAPVALMSEKALFELLPVVNEPLLIVTAPETVLPPTKKLPLVSVTAPPLMMSVPLPPPPAPIFMVAEPVSVTLAPVRTDIVPVPKLPIANEFVNDNEPEFSTVTLPVAALLSGCLFWVFSSMVK